MQIYMNIIRIIALALIFASTFSTTPAIAQKSHIQEHPDNLFFEAWELFEKEKYAAAQLMFEEILEKPEKTSAILHQRAEYLRAKCAVELYNNDAQYMLYDYVKNNPDG